MTEVLHLGELRRCFRGAVPAVIATATADGTPNITYLSSVHLVDNERVALSNQFFSKTSRNLAENPRASLLVIDPLTYDEYRLEVVFERTERRGALFESLRSELEAVACMSGMQEVFRLKAADVYRVVQIEPVLGAAARRGDPPPAVPPALDPATAADRMSELATRLARATDLDVVVETSVVGLAELLDYEHAFLALRDESGERLYVIASHGYDSQGVGSELSMDDGPVGLAARRCSPIRLGAMQQMARYGRVVRSSYEHRSSSGDEEIPLPGLDVRSLVAVPAMASGELVGVLVVESTHEVAFDETDEQILTVAATLIAAAIENERLREEAAVSAPETVSPEPGTRGGTPTSVRVFERDASVFVDGEYLIKGVAGRILRALLEAHEASGRVDFTNRELRLDPSLELPEYRANLESRLILLKRRLDEREVPFRIQKTGRGRFRLDVDADIRLELVSGSDG